MHDGDFFIFIHIMLFSVLVLIFAVKEIRERKDRRYLRDRLMSPLFTTGIKKRDINERKKIVDNYLILDDVVHNSLLSNKNLNLSCA